MTSARKLLRAEIVSVLKAADIVGTNVFSNRILHVDTSDMPCINVYTRDESSQLFDIGNIEYDRSINLIVEILAHDLDQAVNIEDTIDDLAQEIEDAFKANPTMNGKCSDTSLTGTESEANAEGEVPFVMTRLTFNTRYFA